MRITLPIFLFPILFFSQTKDRIVISGEIISETNDLEGITVYNTATNKGTITNSEGVFFIAVAQNDKLEISALQFQKQTIIITEKIYHEKQIKILVTSKVNDLDEVVILQHNLTGNLDEDVKNTEFIKINPLKGLSSSEIKNMTFKSDRFTKVDNQFMNQGQFYNGVDFIALLKLFGVKFKKQKKESYAQKRAKHESEIHDISQVYKATFIHQNFNIPLNKVEAFFGFCYREGLNKELLKPNNRLELYEFLLKKSKLFLKTNE